MRIETITRTIYKFNELTPAAQYKAWQNGPDFSGEHDEQYQTTLAAFEKAFDIKVRNYNVGYPGTTFFLEKTGQAENCPENDPLRLARFIWNNYAARISKGKYYSTPGRYIDGKYSYKKRYSKTTFEMDNCPLTGWCIDHDILQPVLDCLRYKRFYSSYDELMYNCLVSFFEAWESEIDNLNSFEYFMEWVDDNDVEFLENGEIYE